MLERLRGQFCHDYENFGRSMGMLEERVKACGADVQSQNSNIAKVRGRVVCHPGVES